MADLQVGLELRTSRTEYKGRGRVVGGDEQHTPGIYNKATLDQII